MTAAPEQARTLPLAKKAVGGGGAMRGVATQSWSALCHRSTSLREDPSSFMSAM